MHERPGGQSSLVVHERATTPESHAAKARRIALDSTIRCAFEKGLQTPDIR
jgi:hypothetical protein